MTKESGIFADVKAYNDSFSDVILLKMSAYCELYQLTKAGKRFVLKTIKDKSGAMLSILKREYELSIACDHPHIAHVYTYEYLTPVGEGLLMEYIEGRTLTEFLAENPTLSMREKIFEELLSAVEYLHSRSIIHNDLKPENILITRADNTLKIIDFGLSDDDAHYMTKTLGCSPYYASPELLSQSGTDARSDIYSIGRIMQEIFGGRYSSISSKAVASLPEKRYPDIKHLSKAWQRRNRHWKIMLLVGLAALFLLPMYLYTTTYFEQSRLEQENIKLKKKIEAQDAAKSRERDLFAKAEQKVLSMCEQATPEIRDIPFTEFATMRRLKLYEEVAEYQKSLLDTISELKLRSDLYNSTNLVLINYNDTLLNPMILAKPSYYRPDMPLEEALYYQELICNFESYKPYKPEQ